MNSNHERLLTLLLALSLACFATTGCGGGSAETTVPDEAANVEAPSDNPAEEPDMSDGP